MTAQVFRNGQQSTFYVSDALAPATGGGLDGNFQNLTAQKVTDLGAGVSSGRAVVIHKTVPGLSPVEIRGTANDASSGITVTQGGNLLVGFGANTIEANPSGFAFAFAGLDLKLGAGAGEVLRLKSTGIAANTAASNVLALQPGSTTVFTNVITSGATTPAWVTISGWVAPATVSNLAWQRVGNIVSCWGTFSTPSAAVGANVATFTAPVARTSGPFTGAASECTGIVSFRRNAGGDDPGSVAGTAGSLTTVTLTVNLSAPASTGTAQVSFAYQL